MPQYNPDMRRLFLLPRYQRDAAKLLDAMEQDEMERHIADARGATRAFPAEVECGKRAGRDPGVVRALACG